MGNHNLLKNPLLEAEMWAYHLASGWIASFLQVTGVSSLNLPRIYLLTLIPDSIAPFM